jgi:chromosomal replication initiator protein
VQNDKNRERALPSGGGEGPPDDPNSGWMRIRARLRQEFGEAAFANWLKKLTLVRLLNDKVTLGVPNQFLRDWIAAHYGDRIVAHWRGEIGHVRGVEFVVAQVRAEPGALRDPAERARDFAPRDLASRAGGPQAAPVARPLAEVEPGRVEALGRAPAAGRAEPLAVAAAAVAAAPLPVQPADIVEGATPLEPRFTFDSFVVGKPNAFAHAAALRVAEADIVPFNPLFIWGQTGLGKTHLMQSVAWRMLERNPKRKVAYLTAEAFMHRFVKACRFQDMLAFKEQFRSVDVLIIDDVQFLGGKDATQEELFNTFNALVDHRRQVIVSADKPPIDLERLDQRLRSRLGSSLVCQINQSNYELRLAIIESKVARIGVPVPDKVLEFLAHKITSSVRELEGALTRVTAHASLIGREISIEMAREVLHDVLRHSDRHVTIDEIQRVVCEYYKLRMPDLLSPRRARAVARPRQAAMYLSKILTNRSLPEIGRKFGGRDHTTVMHAVRKIEELKASDANIAEDVELLTRQLTE